MRQYKPMADKTIKRFINTDETEVLYAIKTGFQDIWMVVHEDAFEVKLGKVFMGTTDNVEKEYNIKLR